MSSINNSRLALWDLVNDCYNGVPAIKNTDKRQTYLCPFPSEKDKDDGTQYDMRCKLAEYDNIFRTAVNSMVGIMKKQPLKIRFGINDDSDFTGS
jgi:hypothetical protein